MINRREIMLTPPNPRPYSRPPHPNPRYPVTNTHHTTRPFSRAVQCPLDKKYVRVQLEIQ